jgi:transcriptional regulator with XRE-family HTH domain
VNRAEFGQLIAALREDLGWTQAYLAEQVNVEPSKLSNLERGAKKHCEPELLFPLAQALRLTRGERRQLYLAASGLDAEQMMRPVQGYSPARASDPERWLEQGVQLVARLRIPCFLMDVYQDVIAGNAILMDLFNFPVDTIEELRRIPGGLNALWLVHGAGRALEATAQEMWEAFAINNVRVFRENSLRYRTRPYFQYLLKEFRNPGKYPAFERHWRLAASLEADMSAGASGYAYTHPVYGPLAYYALASMTTTRYGELFLYQFVPTDEPTTLLFEDLARKVGPHAYRMASWPDKAMI